jgi:hypothetical protein
MRERRQAKINIHTLELIFLVEGSYRRETEATLLLNSKSENS